MTVAVVIFGYFNLVLLLAFFSLATSTVLYSSFTYAYNYYLQRKRVRAIFVELSEQDQCNVLEALENPVILYNICSHLGTSDILQCSLVNQLWRRETRKFLRERKHCRIILKSNLCSQLSELNNMLKYSSPMDLPFVGLCVQPMKGHYNNQELERCYGKRENISDRFPFIFQKLPVQYLSIDYPTKMDCLGDEFLRYLLLTRAAACTEFLEIISWPANVESLCEYLKDKIRFHNLKTFCHWDYLLRTRDEFIREIVASAPSLANIHGDISSRICSDRSLFIGPHFHPHFPPRKHHLIRNLYIELDWEAYNLTMIESKLEALTLFPTLLKSNDILTNIDNLRPRVLSNVRAIVENSKDTLVECHFGAPHLLSLVVLNNNIGPLKNLSYIILFSYPSKLMFKQTCRLLETIDFETFLPNLFKFELSFVKSECPTSELIVEMNAVINNSAPSKSFNKLTHLEISCEDNESDEFYYLEYVSIWRALAKIFPKVNSLVVPNDVSKTTFWEDVQLQLPWWSSLKFLSSGYTDVEDGRDFWAMLITLLEHLCCNISSAELTSIDRHKIQDYAYAATREPIFYEKGGRGIELQIKFEHTLPCSTFMSLNDWNDRFEKISSWMKVKLPDFRINIEYKSCSETRCNPLWLPIGLPMPTDPNEICRDSKLKKVYLQPWSDIPERSSLCRFADEFFLYWRKSRVLCFIPTYKNNLMKYFEMFCWIYLFLCIRSTMNLYKISYPFWDLILNSSFLKLYNMISVVFIYLAVVQSRERFGSDSLWFWIIASPCMLGELWMWLILYKSVPLWVT